MLMCNETVTLVHHARGQDEDTYTCTAIVGASWYAKTAIVSAGNGANAANVLVCRIPAALLGEDNTPCNGDYIVRGIVAAVDTIKGLDGRNYFRITAVSDNRRGRFPHWKVSGS